MTLTDTTITGCQTEAITLAQQAADAAGRHLSSTAQEAEAACVAAIVIKQAQGLPVPTPSSTPSRQCQANTTELDSHRWISAGWWCDDVAGWCKEITQWQT